MASKSIKGLHQTVGLIVNGVQQVGSFSKVESFEQTPDADLMTSEFLGESESEVDFMHHGWQFRFDVQEEDTKIVDVYESIIVQARAGSPLPRIDVILITAYVDPAVPTMTEIFQEAVLKMDSRSASGRKEYLKAAFSGRCKIKRKI
jgi:hypothetical protein